MKREELLNELEQDLKVDTRQLLNEAADNSKLYAKWLRYYSDVKREWLKANMALSRVKKEKLDWLNGRSDEVCEYAYERSEIKTVLEADTEYQRAFSSVELVGIRLDICKSALDAIKSRGFSIKNAIDMRMLESGK